MKRYVMVGLLSGFLALPYARSWADEGKESAREEKTESRDHQQAEEKEAMTRYQKAVTKHGQNSPEAKKAWKHVVAEYKEHGDKAPAPGSVSTPAKS
jgi:hypothetical protein